MDNQTPIFLTVGEEGLAGGHVIAIAVHAHAPRLVAPYPKSVPNMLYRIRRQYQQARPDTAQYRTFDGKYVAAYKTAIPGLLGRFVPLSSYPRSDPGSAAHVISTVQGIPRSSVLGTAYHAHRLLAASVPAPVLPPGSLLPSRLPPLPPGTTIRDLSTGQLTASTAAKDGPVLKPCQYRTSPSDRVAL
eukprot:1463712-Rhodomonas_salina.1